MSRGINSKNRVEVTNNFDPRVRLFEEGSLLVNTNVLIVLKMPRLTFKNLSKTPQWHKCAVTVGVVCCLVF